MGLAEQPVPRSYHLQDNDWTPLSQNLCWKATIPLLVVFSRSDRLRPNTISNRLNGTKSNKSSVDDLDMELGIVRARVGLSYDPLRLSPSSGDLWFTIKSCAHALIVRVHPPPPIQPTKRINQTNKTTTTPLKKSHPIGAFSRLLQYYWTWTATSIGWLFFCPFSRMQWSSTASCIPLVIFHIWLFACMLTPTAKTANNSLKVTVHLNTAKRWKVVPLARFRNAVLPQLSGLPLGHHSISSSPKTRQVQEGRNFPQRTTTTRTTISRDPWVLLPAVCHDRSPRNEPCTFRTHAFSVPIAVIPGPPLKNEWVTTSEITTSDGMVQSYVGVLSTKQ